MRLTLRPILQCCASQMRVQRPKHRLRIPWRTCAGAACATCPRCSKPFVCGSQPLLPPAAQCALLTVLCAGSPCPTTDFHEHFAELAASQACLSCTCFHSPSDICSATFHYASFGPSFHCLTLRVNHLMSSACCICLKPYGLDSECSFTGFVPFVIARSVPSQLCLPLPQACPLSFLPLLSLSCTSWPTSPAALCRSAVSIHWSFLSSLHFADAASLLTVLWRGFPPACSCAFASLFTL